MFRAIFFMVWRLGWQVPSLLWGFSRVHDSCCWLGSIDMHTGADHAGRKRLPPSVLAEHGIAMHPDLIHKKFLGVLPRTQGQCNPDPLAAFVELWIVSLAYNL